MDNEQTVIQELFKGLKALYGDLFPKRCSGCGTLYETVDDFLRQTIAQNMPEGLLASPDLNQIPIVELFRKCSCGTSIMDVIGDRRDLTQAGIRRRQRFGTLLDTLEHAGVPREFARDELLKLMHGQDSPFLRDMGIKIRGQKPPQSS